MLIHNDVVDICLVFLDIDKELSSLVKDLVTVWFRHDFPGIRQIVFTDLGHYVAILVMLFYKYFPFLIFLLLPLHHLVLLLLSSGLLTLFIRNTNSDNVVRKEQNKVVQLC